MNRLIGLPFRSLALSLLVLASCAKVQEPPAPPRPDWPDAALVELRQAAASAPSHGLPEETAAIAELDLYLDRSLTDASAVQQVDLIANELFARLARSYAMGALDPGLVDPAWRLPLNLAPDTERLQAEAWRRGVAVVLSELLPAAADYGALRGELARVEAEAEGTLDAAGRSREQRLDSLRASLERWRWLPRELPQNRIEAHIAQFEVAAFAEGRLVRTHAAIVGARSTQTPAFGAEMSAVTLNPAWIVPRSIIVNELLPRFRRDPAAASRLGYDVIDARGRTLDPASINWSGSFPYTLRRRPGPGNPLGRIKFEMPNPFAIYLHDTSNPELFERTDRALSHGCIRLDDPEELALALLGPSWDRDTLEAEIERGATRSLPFDAPTPFYAIYMTATAAAGGGIVYADDIYGRDGAIVAALAAPRVAPAASTVAVAEGCIG